MVKIENEKSKNPLKCLEAKIVTEDYKIIKAVSKPTCKDVIRYDSYTLIEYIKKEKKIVKPKKLKLNCIRTQ